MRRFTISTLLVVPAVLALAIPSQAAMRWCKSDPIFTLHGTRVQVLVSVPEEYKALVNGPVKVEIKAPKLAERELLYTDAGFNGYGEVVKFSNLSGEGNRWRHGNRTLPARIKVKVPVDRSELPKGVRHVPVQVEIIPEKDSMVVIEGTSERTEIDLPITTEVEQDETDSEAQEQPRRPRRDRQAGQSSSPGLSRIHPPGS